MISSKALSDKFREALNDGWGYIWGQSGAVWTEKKQRAATREMTVRYGSKWIGDHVADCSGLFVWAFKQLGGSIYHGSNTIWRQYCTSKGTLRAGQQLRPGTALFLVRDGVRHHIGLYVGDDTVIEAKGTRYGVVKSRVSHWDEWGELRGVSYEGEEALETVYPTLRRGMRGEDVKMMQEKLTERGYPVDIDGIFGAKTEQAVRAFQEREGLKADGICGPRTWAALNDEEGMGSIRSARDETVNRLCDRLCALEKRTEELEGMMMEDREEE